MAGRKVVFANGEYYHLFNRGIARQPVFLDKRDYERFLLTLKFYRLDNLPVRLSRFLQLPQEERGGLEEKFLKAKKIVELITFSLMPNHYHFLVKQLKDKGISIFLSKLTNSYTRYYNVKRKRVGDLFQGVFKAVLVETDEQLLHLSRYIHLNPLVSYVVDEKNFLNYQWSSLPDYLKGKFTLVNSQPVLSFFNSPKKYLEFVLDQADYMKELESIKHLIIE